MEKNCCNYFSNETDDLDGNFSLSTRCVHSVQRAELSLCICALISILAVVSPRLSHIAIDGLECWRIVSARNSYSILRWKRSLSESKKSAVRHMSGKLHVWIIKQQSSLCTICVERERFTFSHGDAIATLSTSPELIIHLGTIHSSHLHSLVEMDFFQTGKLPSDDSNAVSRWS